MPREVMNRRERRNAVRDRARKHEASKYRLQSVVLTGTDSGAGPGRLTYVTNLFSDLQQFGAENWQFSKKSYMYNMIENTSAGSGGYFFEILFMDTSANEFSSIDWEVKDDLERQYRRKRLLMFKLHNHQRESAGNTRCMRPDCDGALHVSIPPVKCDSEHVLKYGVWLPSFRTPSIQTRYTRFIKIWAKEL